MSILSQRKVAKSANRWPVRERFRHKPRAPMQPRCGRTVCTGSLRWLICSYCSAIFIAFLRSVCLVDTRRCLPCRSRKQANQYLLRVFFCEASHGRKMDNPAGNKPPGVMATFSNFHSIPSLSVSLVNPLFESFGGHQWKSMDRLWRARGSNPLTSSMIT
jgi:hypothetical protein